MSASTPRARSMSEIKSQLMTPATTSNYEVFFGLPPALGLNGNEEVKSYIKSVDFGFSYTSNDQILINLSCTDASLPGSSFTTHELTNDFSGVTEKHAYRRQFDGEIDFTFLVDRNYKLIRLFESWMGYIIDEKKEFEPQLRNSTYRVKFPKDYQTNALHIVKFEKDIGRIDEQSQMIYTFVNAFPISINSMPISYNQSELLSVNVTMSYTRYYIEKMKKVSDPINTEKLTESEFESLRRAIRQDYIVQLQNEIGASVSGSGGINGLVDLTQANIEAFNRERNQ